MILEFAYLVWRSDGVCNIRIVHIGYRNITNIILLPDEELPVLILTSQHYRELCAIKHDNFTRLAYELRDGQISGSPQLLKNREASFGNSGHAKVDTGFKLEDFLVVISNDASANGTQVRRHIEAPILVHNAEGYAHTPNENKMSCCERERARQRVK